MDARKFVTPKKYLSVEHDAKDIDGKTVVIDGVFPEVINENEKLVMRLKGLEKKLAMNQTNIMTMVKAFGENTDKWVNQTIALRVVNITVGGNLIGTIQIKV